MLSSFPNLSLITKCFISKPLTLLTLVPTVVVAVVVPLEAVCWLLFWLFIGDLASGLAASYFDWKAKVGTKDRWFFGTGEGFSSDKFKKCFVKMIIYAATPLLVLQFQKTFLIKNFKYKSITDAEIEITTLIILVFCIVEFFSIFNENLPRCGFNIFKIIKSIIGVGKDLKNHIEK